MDDEEMMVYHPTPREDPLLYFKENTIPKKYSSCERATKGLLRCINTKHFKMKIGEECISFCQSHIVEAIAKVMLLIMKEDWYVDYWDPIMNRWETERLIFSNSDEFAIDFNSLDEYVQNPYNIPRLYQIVAFLQTYDNSEIEEEDESDNENGTITVDFEEPFIGTAYKELLPRGRSMEEYHANQDDMESKSLENLVVHFFKYHELQPFDMVFQASLTTWTNEYIEKRFIIQDEDGDPQINIQFAPHIRCGNIKIPSTIEMDMIESQDDETDYFIVVHVLIDFSV
jgi:hypothetical protein